MILTPLQKLLKNVGDLGKIIVVTGFEWLPKVQKIAQFDHTDHALMVHASIRCIPICTSARKLTSLED